MRPASILLALLLLSRPAGAQRSPSGTFQVLTNTFEDKPRSRSTLTLGVDHGLPANGWKIYFNFARLIVPGSATGDIDLAHINGDLYCISPQPGFPGVAPGGTLAFTFSSGDWLINRTDKPDGFYLTRDAAPGKAYRMGGVRMLPPTRPDQYLRSPQDRVDTVTPASLYMQNAPIQPIPEDSLVRVFPSPLSYQAANGHFTLKTGISIRTDARFTAERDYLKATLRELLIRSARRSRSSIVLSYRPMAAEAYELTVKDERITIAASGSAGIFYGIQSLKTLMPPDVYGRKRRQINISNVEVKDTPRFPYRALMLDVARNFQPKSEIFKLLDVLSLYKMNVLHFHLTDDEGWRLEIPGLPELTSVGARRGSNFAGGRVLQPGLGSDAGSASGFYSIRDYIRILRYATQRHIRVIPEIESPGHARAAIKAMDARYERLIRAGRRADAGKYLLHDPKDTSRYLSAQYYHDNVADVAMPSAYRFMRTVTRALINIYHDAGAPLETIHFGGDEVPAGAWTGSPAFERLRQRDTSIRTAGDLWPYYYLRMDRLLRSRGLYLTGWEEAGMYQRAVRPALPGHNIHLEVWNNVLGWGAEDLAYKQANAGYQVILSCVSNLYLDMACEKAFEEPGYYWGGYVDVEQLFKFIPYDYFRNTTEDRMGQRIASAYFKTREQLTTAGKKNIAGLQGALWGETLKSPRSLEYMLLPKLLGLAERCWAADPGWAVVSDSAKARRLYAHSWSGFVHVLGERELPRLDHYAGGFAYRIPEPGAVLCEGRLLCDSPFPGLIIRYTTDGKVPGTGSPVYHGPVTIPPGERVRIALFNNEGRSGRAVMVESR